jgi:DtxR family Mn-dependent transcriptional regulator|tara:strand:+ start:956 stop:1606 length:651 start_codon:yes stop_codon:yes gene_type:complete
MKELSEFEEMYLKRMFEIHSKQPSAIVKTSSLAEMMSVSAASTTEMIQRLAGRGLVTYIPYKGSRLTTEGFSIAAKIKRRQLLIEMLLTDVIGFEGDIYSISCEMEHAINDQLEAAIDGLLGYPEETNSGERVPQVARHFETDIHTTLLPILNMPDESSGEIEFIALSGQESKTLESQNVKIGNVVSKSGNGLFVDKQLISISDNLAKKILVRLGG